MRKTQLQKNTAQTPLLYKMVFGTISVRYVALFVFVFFVVHPVVPAFASEDVPVESIVEEPLPVPESEVPSEPAPEPAPIVTEEQAPEEVIQTQSVEVMSDEVILESTPEELETGNTQNTQQENVSEEDTLLLEAGTQTSVTTTTSSSSSETELNQDDEASTPQENTDTDLELDTPVPSDLELLSQQLATSSDESTNFSTSTDSGVASTTQETSSTTSSIQNKSDENTNDGSSNQSESATDDAQQFSSDNTQTISDTNATTTATTSSDSEAGSDTNTTESSGDEVDSNEQESENQETDSSEDVALVEQTASSSTPAEVVTSTEEVVLPVAIAVTNNLNAYQFADKECVSVGNGSFYCSEIDGAPEYVEDGVFSAPDSDGDTEIYVTINGQTTQITNNLTDDASPYYDGLSNTIVWHSMINDRFQITQYDVETGEITYLTDTSYNNMEPIVYDDLVLWQAWIGDNWEIMLLNNDELSQLTDNDMHDITPQMRDGYIMWQTQFAEGWKIALYDMKTGKIEYIADSDGSEVANPRFVLVYDSTDKIGDVQTLGYDFGSGNSFVLGSLPAEIPEEIPQPDQTGETRALIQAKPATREGEVEEVVPTSSGTGSSTPPTGATPTNATSSSTILAQEGDLIIEPVASSSTSVATENASTTAQTITPEVEPVEIPEQATTTDTAHIEDVVIPPFSASSTQEVG